MSKRRKQPELPPGIVHCNRCHVRLRTGTPDPKARLLRISDTAKGFCLNCAVTDWFKTTTTVAEILERDGIDGLRLPHIRKQFLAVCRVGKAQVDPKQIDWDEVIANWELPFPRERRKARRKT